MSGRAAHFLRHASLIGTPPTDAIVSAYRELGLEVDLYAPDVGASIEGLGRFQDGVTMYPFSYGKRWILQHFGPLLKRRYSVISANAEDPIGVAAPLAKLSRCPLIVSADEIFSGSYRGDAPERWKRFCRWGMRGANLTIVNDPSRIVLQREYAVLREDHPILVYPGCFRDPPVPAAREQLREKWRLPADAFVLVVSGQFTADHAVIAVHTPYRVGSFLPM